MGGSQRKRWGFINSNYENLFEYGFFQGGRHTIQVRARLGNLNDVVQTTLPRELDKMIAAVPAKNTESINYHSQNLGEKNKTNTPTGFVSVTATTPHFQFPNIQTGKCNFNREGKYKSQSHCGRRASNQIATWGSDKKKQDRSRVISTSWPKKIALFGATALTKKGDIIGGENKTRNKLCPGASTRKKKKKGNLCQKRRGKKKQKKCRDAPCMRIPWDRSRI